MVTLFGVDSKKKKKFNKKCFHFVSNYREAVLLGGVIFLRASMNPPPLLLTLMLLVPFSLLLFIRLNLEDILQLDESVLISNALTFTKLKD